MNPILAEFLSYRDKHGLIQPGPLGSLNGILYTGESMVVMKDNDVLTPQVEDELFKVIKSCELYPGLMTRTPTFAGGQQAHDDYVGFLAACYQCKRYDLAEIVLQYGQRTTKFGFIPFKFVFNTVIPGTMLHPTTEAQNAKRPWYERLFTRYFAEPGFRINFSAWLGRLPQFVAHVYWASNKKPPLLHRIAQAIVIWNNSKLKDGGHPDTWMLTWLMVRTMDNRCWMGRWAAKKFYANMHRIFGPEGLKKLFYIGGKHPINKYWVK
jgi:hypothetical protein